jgi:hypothetical protein
LDLDGFAPTFSRILIFSSKLGVLAKTLLQSAGAYLVKPHPRGNLEDRGSLTDRTLSLERGVVKSQFEQLFNS